MIDSDAAPAPAPRNLTPAEKLQRINASMAEALALADEMADRLAWWRARHSRHPPVPFPRPPGEPPVGRGCHHGRASPALSVEQIARVRELRAVIPPLTLVEIARVVGVSTTTVRRRSEPSAQAPPSPQNMHRNDL